MQEQNADELKKKEKQIKYCLVEIVKEKLNVIAQSTVNHSLKVNFDENEKWISMKKLKLSNAIERNSYRNISILEINKKKLISELVD